MITLSKHGIREVSNQQTASTKTLLLTSYLIMRRQCLSSNIRNKGRISTFPTLTQIALEFIASTIKVSKSNKDIQIGKGNTTVPIYRWHT